MTENWLSNSVITHFDQRGQQLAFFTFISFIFLGLLKRHLDLISSHSSTPSALATPGNCLGLAHLESGLVFPHTCAWLSAHSLGPWL